MSQALQARAEILKLARLLQRSPETLAYLDGVPPDALRALRDQITDVLFSAHDQVLERLVAASHLLPTSLVAAIGERAFGPLLSARIAGRLDPQRALDMAGRLPVAFLADVAAEIDPRRASSVIAGIPPARVAEITRELVRRGEYVTLGRFVGHLGRGAVAAAVRVIDDASLLQVAFVLESKDGLAELVDLLPPERLDRVIDAAAREDLWPEVLDLVGHLSPDQQQRLADAAAGHDDGALTSLVRSATTHDIWAAALPVGAAMSEDSRRRFASLPSIGEPEVLQRIVAAARENDAWEQLLPLVPFLPQEVADRLGTIVGGLELRETEVARLVAAREDPALRPGVERLAELAGLQARLSPGA